MTPDPTPPTPGRLACDCCGGTGAESVGFGEDDDYICPVCNGTGLVPTPPEPFVDHPDEE